MSEARGKEPIESDVLKATAECLRESKRITYGMLADRVGVDAGTIRRLVQGIRAAGRWPHDGAMYLGPMGTPYLRHQRNNRDKLMSAASGAVKQGRRLTVEKLAAAASMAPSTTRNYVADMIREGEWPYDFPAMRTVHLEMADAKQSAACHPEPPRVVFAPPGKIQAAPDSQRGAEIDKALSDEAYTAIGKYVVGRLRKSDVVTARDVADAITVINLVWY